jgi:hypothetical protein
MEDRFLLFVISLHSFYKHMSICFLSHCHNEYIDIWPIYFFYLTIYPTIYVISFDIFICLLLFLNLSNNS